MLPHVNELFALIIFQEIENAGNIMLFLRIDTSNLILLRNLKHLHPMTYLKIFLIILLIIPNTLHQILQLTAKTHHIASSNRLQSPRLLRKNCTISIYLIEQTMLAYIYRFQRISRDLTIRNYIDITLRDYVESLLTSRNGEVDVGRIDHFY